MQCQPVPTRVMLAINLLWVPFGMGAGASTPYTTTEEALAAGKTQAEVDAWIKANRSAVMAASAASVPTGTTGSIENNFTDVNVETVNNADSKLQKTETGWYYHDKKDTLWGPFPDKKMRTWWCCKKLSPDLLVRKGTDGMFVPVHSLGPDAFIVETRTKLKSVDDARPIIGTTTNLKSIDDTDVIVDTQIESAETAPTGSIDNTFTDADVETVNNADSKLQKTETGWYYHDKKDTLWGPFPDKKMRTWWCCKKLSPDLLVRKGTDGMFVPVHSLGPDAFKSPKALTKP